MKKKSKADKSALMLDYGKKGITVKRKKATDGINISEFVPKQAEEPIAFIDQSDYTIKYQTQPLDVKKDEVQQNWTEDYKNLSKKKQIKVDQNLYKPLQGTNMDQTYQDWFNQKWNNKDNNISQNMTMGLQIGNALIPNDNPKRQYLQPSNQQYYNPYPKGTGSQAIMKKGGDLEIDSKKTYINGKDNILPQEMIYLKSIKKGDNKTAQESLKYLSQHLDQQEFEDLQSLAGEYKSSSFQKPLDFFKNHKSDLKTERLQSLKNIAINDPNAPFLQYEHGGNIYTRGDDFKPKSMRMGGHFSTADQKAELTLYSPDSKAKKLSSSIIKFEGKEHGEKNQIGSEGIPITYGNSPVEVEHDETGFQNSNGDFTVLGNMKNPITGRLFKNDGKMLAKQEQKIDKQKSKALKYIDNSDTQNPFEMLSFNTGKAKLMGAEMKTQKIQQQKQALNDLQNLMLINETQKAENGITIPKAYKGVDTGPESQTGSKYKSRFGLDAWTGNKTGLKNKTASSYTTEQWDNIAEQLGFTGQGNKEFQQFLLNDPRTKGLVSQRHKELYGKDPFVDSKLGYGWNADFSQATNPEPLQQGDWTPWTKRMQKSITFPSVERLQDYMPSQQPAKKPITGVKQQSPNIPTKTGEDVSYKGADWRNYVKPLTILGEPLQTVQMQQYDPLLEQPFQYSFQDRRNQVQNNIRAMQQTLGGNAAELATATALTNEQLQPINAEEFRINQGEAARVYNQNRATMNDAQLKNLQLIDQQYQRQTAAKTNTFDRRAGALDQIAQIEMQNKKDWNEFNVYKQMFPTYGFDKKTNQAYVKNPYEFQFNQQPVTQPVQNSVQPIEQDVVERAKQVAGKPEKKKIITNINQGFKRYKP